MTTYPTPLRELLKLTNKTVLITGAAMGIGKAIAWRYAEAGAALQLIDRDGDALQQTATELREQFDAAVTTYIVDLSDHNAVTALWHDITPTPDILINNAGILHQSSSPILTRQPSTRQCRSTLEQCSPCVKK